MTKITQALTRLFERHRIVVWYDAKRELRGEYEGLVLPGVTKIELANNEFGVKYRVLREEFKGRYLLYHEGPQPPDVENWLLDVVLAHGVFRADQVSLWLSELGLGQEFWDVVGEHAVFFRAASRRQALQGMLAADDTATGIRMKMLAVCVGSAAIAGGTAGGTAGAAAGGVPRVEAILEVLLDELAGTQDGECPQAALIARSGLDGFLWERVETLFGYASETQGVKDFALALFKAGYAMGLDEPAALTAEARLFLRRWQDSVRYHDAFETLSRMSAEILGIEHDLLGRELRELADLDLFELIEQRILSEVVQRMTERTIAPVEVTALIRQRQQLYWAETYAALYAAVATAAQFFTALESVDLTVRSLADGVATYARTWYRLDQLYRDFITHYREANQVSLLESLMERVEDGYTNLYLLKLNDTWQTVVDGVTWWDAPPVLRQQDFYEHEVASYLGNRRKVAVVVSDALRYEAAEALQRRIAREDRYEAELVPMLGVLPSYTQLGMAALLPHTRLAIKPEDATVTVDGRSATGTIQRDKILSLATGGAGTVLQSEALMGMNRDDSRALIRDHQIVYVYHNRIDAVGDKLATESGTAQAVAQALDELVDIVKKLAAANVTNILVTADHGFIYQHRALDESDYADVSLQGEAVLHHDRRFVLGSGLADNASLRAFSPAQLGVEAPCEIYFAKSINRLRKQGSGSRYVHGGASLQEIVVPLLRINKTRSSDLAWVDVEIIGGPSGTITTNQLGVTFYQAQPVSAKVLPRTLRAGIYTQDGELISDSHELTFDAASDSARERETKVRFLLGQRAERVNNQEVLLKLEEPVAGTSHYRTHRSARYVMRRSFVGDFDL